MARGSSAHGARHLRTFVLVAGVALVLFASGSAWATTARKLELPQLAEESSAVVVGEVARQHTFRADDGIIYTDTTLKVDEVLVGRAGATLTFRQMGGVVDGVRRIVPGDATFHDGERVVVFVADREPDSGVVFLTALSQSKYSVVGQDDDGDLLLVRDFNGLTFYDPASVEPFRGEKAEHFTLGKLRAAIAAQDTVKEAK